MRSMVWFFCLTLAVLGLATAQGAPALPDQLLANYYAIQKSLAADSMSGVAGAAAELARISKRASVGRQAGKAELIALSESAAQFSSADLKAARAAFGDLSARMIAFVKASKSLRNPPYQYYCSMAKKNWLQAEKGARNPYYGSSMLTCGELVP